MQRVGTPYDPMRLYARVLYHFKGGITDADLARMDYRRFFGYVRELDYILREEAEAMNGKGKKHAGQVEMQAALRDVPQPQHYTGETIRLI